MDGSPHWPKVPRPMTQKFGAALSHYQARDVIECNSQRGTGHMYWLVRGPRTCDRSVLSSQ